MSKKPRHLIFCVAGDDKATEVRGVNKMHVAWILFIDGTRALEILNPDDKQTLCLTKTQLTR